MSKTQDSDHVAKLQKFVECSVRCTTPFEHENRVSPHWDLNLSALIAPGADSNFETDGPPLRVSTKSLRPDHNITCVVVNV